MHAALELLRSAREGTALLCRSAPPLFAARAFGADDWDFLVSLCDDEARLDMLTQHEEITEKIRGMCASFLPFCMKP